MDPENYEKSVEQKMNNGLAEIWSELKSSDKQAIFKEVADAKVCRLPPLKKIGGCRELWNWFSQLR